LAFHVVSARPEGGRGPSAERRGKLRLARAAVPGASEVMPPVALTDLGIVKK
jgi:hypothetical protein